MSAQVKPRYRTVPELSTHFMKSLYGGADPALYVNIFSLPSKRSEWFPAADLDAAGDYAADQAENVYFGLGLHRTPPKEGRGGAAAVCAVPAIGFDLDFAGPAHAKKRLPPRAKEASTLLQAFPLRPSMVLHTGNGLQAFWILRELWVFESEAEREYAGRLSKGVQNHLRILGRDRGWDDLDQTGDLARVFRVPGTLNRKNDPAPLVRILHDSPATRYNPDDFEPYIAEAPRKLRVVPAGPAVKSESRELSERLQEAKSALASLDPDEPYGAWLERGMALHDATGGSEEGFGIWDSWSQAGDKYQEGLTREKWDTFTPGAGVTLNSIFHDAKAAGWTSPRSNGKPKQAGTSTDVDTGAEVGQRDRSHDGLALELGDLWQDNARHVAAWGTWFFSDNSTWREDRTLHHMTGARRFLRDKADQLQAEAETRAAGLASKGDKIGAERARAEGLTAAKRLRDKQTVAAVVDLARSNQAQAAGVEQWDADPMLMGTPGGTLDLTRGTLRPAKNTDYITKSAAVAPAPAGTPCPLWLAFLDRVTGGNAEMVAYLQRQAGYVLTGSVEEHAFFFPYGLGANGKSVYATTQMGIMKDYARAFPTEMLTVSQNDRHPTELARLRGVRLAVGSETEEGARWAEAKIKALTGGDPIAARHMRQDFFEYQPTFKLMVLGNHKPSLRGVDAAIRRRLHLVPFTVTIPKKEQDTKLTDKLRAEWPAILRWMLEGCTEWQRQGLNPPAIVRGATTDYLDAEDSTALWLDDRTEVDPNAWEAGGALFRSWKEWAERAGEFVGSQKRLTQVLQDRGLVPHRLGDGTRGFRGRRLKAQNQGERWEP